MPHTWRLYNLVFHTPHLQAFAETLVALGDEVVMDKDFVWIHDYHLLVLPSLLRKRFNRIR